MIKSHSTSPNASFGDLLGPYRLDTNRLRAGRAAPKFQCSRAMSSGRLAPTLHHIMSVRAVTTATGQEVRLYYCISEYRSTDLAVKIHLEKENGISLVKPFLFRISASHPRCSKADLIIHKTMKLRVKRIYTLINYTL